MNVKQKILDRLGLENDEELLNLLDLSNRLDKIKFFYPEFQFDSNNLIEMKLENTGYFKLIGTDNKKISATNSLMSLKVAVIIGIFIEDISLQGNFINLFLDIKF